MASAATITIVLERSRRGLLNSTWCPASGSGTGPKINGPTLAWSRVTLPRDVEPLTLTATGSRLLVGGWVYVIAKQAVGPAVLWQCPVKDLG
jgi:hypothetical protein